MSTVNYTNPNQDRTVTIFDEFYTFKLEVDANLYDVVNSYFKSVFADENAAKNFTLSLFRISENSGIPAITLLDEVKGQNTHHAPVNCSTIKGDGEGVNGSPSLE